MQNWISRIANQPTTVWWAGRQTGLHPELQQQIKYRIAQNSEEFPAAVRQAWRYIFEAWAQPRNEFYSDWYDLDAVIKSEGWSSSVVRQVAKVKRPYLAIRTPFGGLKPPEADAELHLHDLLSVEVKYSDIREELKVPAAHLPQLVKELRKNLEFAVTLEREIGGYGLEILHPIDEPDSHPHGISSAVVELVTFFNRLIDENEEAAKTEALAWRENGDQIFTRLNIGSVGIGELYQMPMQADFSQIEFKRLLGRQRTA